MIQSVTLGSRLSPDTVIQSVTIGPRINHDTVIQSDRKGLRINLYTVIQCVSIAADFIKPYRDPVHL